MIWILVIIAILLLLLVLANDGAREILTLGLVALAGLALIVFALGVVGVVLLLMFAG